MLSILRCRGLLRRHVDVRPRRRALAIGAAAALTVCAGVIAATPTFWTVSTQGDFLKGDVEDLSIDSDGRMFPGPSASLVAETAAPFLWTVVAGTDGTLWAGSGNEGHVLKVGKDGKLSTFFDATELEVHALAPAPDGGLYVGTSPDGKVYRVAADGTAKVFFDPEDKYIWALAVDQSGNVFAATGDKGVIYKITPDGKGERFYKTNAANVVSLAFTKKGELIAGTESPGRVFRIDEAGKAFVLMESPFREIHAVRLHLDSAGAPVTPSRRPRCDLSHQARWPVGRDVGLRRRRALRPGDRAIGQLARRHRHRGKDLPHQRRSGTCDAAGPRLGTTGHGAVARAFGTDRRRGKQPREAFCAVPHSRPTRYLRIGRARCGHGGQLGRDPLACVGGAG